MLAWIWLLTLSEAMLAWIWLLTLSGAMLAWIWVLTLHEAMLACSIKVIGEIPTNTRQQFEPSSTVIENQPKYGTKQFELSIEEQRDGSRRPLMHALKKEPQAVNWVWFAQVCVGTLLAQFYINGGKPCNTIYCNLPLIRTQK